MIQLRELQTFELLAEQGNMTRVAQKLSKSVMAVSKQIANLEQSVGQPLFIRTRRELKLTEFGEQFRSKARGLIQQHRELQHWVEASEAEINGEIRVLTQANDVITETLAPWMGEFLEKFPSVSVVLDVKESVVDIKQDEYDIYWGIGPYLGERFTGLKQRLLLKERYGIFASPDYLNKKGTPKTPDDLDNHDVISYLYNEPNNVLVLQGKNGEIIYKMLNAKVKTVAGMLEFAQLGLGLLNIPPNARQVKAAVEAKTLVPVMEDYWWDKAEAFIYYHQTNIAEAKVRAFIDFFFDKKQFWM